MTLDSLNTDPSLVRTPKRVQRERFAAGRHNVVDVGSGTKWNNPVKKSDVMSLMSTERDIAAAVDARGWKAGSVILYRDWLLEEELDPTSCKERTCPALANCLTLVMPTYSSSWPTPSAGRNFPLV